MGACTSVSDCAYQLLNQRAAASQNSFFVYQDDDSGFNHGFASGLFGTIDLSKVIINSGCVDSSTSSNGCSSDSTSLDVTRGTVFSISFPPLSGTDFVGLNFQDPENYDGQTIIGTGYNLTPATDLQFDVRSPNGAIVQFGVGGCVTGFFTLGQSWATVTVPINTLVLPPGGLPTTCPPDLTSIHILFTVGTNAGVSPNGGTVLLDNIKFAPVPARQTSSPITLSLPLSTQTFGVVPVENGANGSDIPPDQADRNSSAVYESALTALSLFKRGQAGDVTNALEIANTLDYALYHDNHGDPIPTAPNTSAGCFSGIRAQQCGLHSAYSSGDIGLLNNQPPPANGQAGDVRLAGFSGGTTLCGSTGFCLVLDGATGGNNAWAMLALMAAYQQSENVTYLNDAITIGNWIVANLTDTSGTGYGGYFLGYNDEGQPKQVIVGKSTENSAYIFAAFALLAQIETLRGNSSAAAQWMARATAAGDFVMAMFGPASGRFYAGTVAAGIPPNPPAGICEDPFTQKGNDVINTCDFLDANSFATLPMAGSSRYEGQIDWTRPAKHMLGTFAQTVTAGGQAYQGFDIVAAPSAGANGVAWEFTGQTAETCNYLDGLLNVTTFQVCIQTYIPEILQAHNSAPFGDGLGLVASTMQDGDVLPPVSQCLRTPFQCIPERVGLAATNWGIIADQNFNPLSAADFSLNASVPGPITLSAGHSASATVIVSSQTGFNGGFNGSVTLTCSVQPAPPFAPTCSVNPASVNPAGVSANATLMIDTTGSTAFLRAPLLPHDLHPPYVLLPFASVVLLSVGFIPGRPRRKRLRGLLLCAIFVGLGALVACGGGNGNSHTSTTTGTPPGTYTVTILGTAGSTQHTTTVTLTVQ